MGQGPEKSTSQLQALLQNRDQRKGLCPHTTGDPEEGRGGSASRCWSPSPEAELRKEEETGLQQPPDFSQAPPLSPPRLTTSLPGVEPTHCALSSERQHPGPLATTSRLYSGSPLLIDGLCQGQCFLKWIPGPLGINSAGFCYPHCLPCIHLPETWNSQFPQPLSPGGWEGVLHGLKFGSSPGLPAPPPS